MNGPRLEVADVFREFGSQFLERFGRSLSIDQKHVFHAIVACRTPALGGHLYQRDIGPIALQNKRVVYGIFKRAAAQTIKELATDSKHPGAQIGI